MSQYTVDVIAGDGIGQEVMPAAIACVDALAPAHGFSVQWRDREWGSEHYRRHGRMMPEDGIAQLATGDAILLGAVGAEDIPDVVTLWGLLIPIRREFDQYVNLRPMRLLPGVRSPLAARRRARHGLRPRELRGRVLRRRRAHPPRHAPRRSRSRRRSSPATGIERIAATRSSVAKQRSGADRLGATKSNALIHSMVLWDEVVEEVVAETTGITVEKVPRRRARRAHGHASRRRSTSSSRRTCSATS